MTARDMESRLARLEEGVFFQDRLLGDLNAALASQQRQLDTLERAVAETRERMEELRQLLEEGGPANLPPPHYR